MTGPDPQTTPLDRLAASRGIHDHYIGNEGNRHPTTRATKILLLSAMGVAVRDDRDALQQIECDERARWMQLAPPAVVVRQGAAPVELLFHVTDEEAAAHGRVVVRLRDENGRLTALDPALSRTAATAGIDGTTWVEWYITLPPLPVGGYDVEVSVAGARARTSSSVLWITPAECYVPAKLQAGRRVFGYSAQLYSLRSDVDQGIGDLAALGEAVRFFGREHGADLFGISPLHLTPNEPPHDYSPYCPLSRVWRNFIYLDVFTSPEVIHSAAAQSLLKSRSVISEVNALRRLQRADPPRIAQFKLKILRAAFSDARQIGLPEEYMQFRRDAGVPLERFATFLALRDHHRRSPGGSGWFREWPAGHQDPSHQDVAAFRAAHSDEIEFYCYLQFMIDRDVRNVQQMALDAGMSIGLYHDLAVGVSGGSADVWCDPELYISDAEIGAPPDAFNENGQVWGVAPWNPTTLAERAYEPFLQLLRRVMRGAGALRLDHVMGLFRLWWVPRGRPATEGAYVTYPHDDLLGLIALESHRAKCMIVGEDLGTVPPGVRDRLAAERIPGCRLVLFERGAGGEFYNPRHLPASSVASFSTHDLPTLAGFWLGRDIDSRVAAGLLTNPAAIREARLAREADRRSLLDALERDGMDVSDLRRRKFTDHEAVDEIITTVHRWLARTGAAVLLVSLEDALGEEIQRNLPGTVGTHPNWILRFSRTAADFHTDHRLRAVAAAVRAALPPLSHFKGS